MLDTRAGEVVHIDYGICFEKGLKLRIPEVVPFRLTQCMHHALGSSGVEGMFRVGAEQVLQVIPNLMALSLSTVCALLSMCVPASAVFTSIGVSMLFRCSVKTKKLLSLFLKLLCTILW